MPELCREQLKPLLWEAQVHSACRWGSGQGLGNAADKPMKPMRCPPHPTHWRLVYKPLTGQLSFHLKY